MRRTDTHTAWINLYRSLDGEVAEAVESYVERAYPEADHDDFYQACIDNAASVAAEYGVTI